VGSPPPQLVTGAGEEERYPVVKFQHFFEMLKRLKHVDKLSLKKYVLMQLFCPKNVGFNFKRN
jgi:hypothetical protein